MTNGKSPGYDGYTVDCYKKNGKILVHCLIGHYIEPINGNRGLILLAITAEAI
jgi:hypothetical protein